MRLVNFQQGTSEWHAWRMSGLGGSDAPVVLKESPHKTPRQLHLEKSGILSEEEDSSKEFIFSKGHKVEGLIRKQFAELTGVEMKPICVIHEKYDHIISSLDGYDSKLGPLEAKLVGANVLMEASNNGIIPTHHMIQIQHQIETTGSEVGSWFGHDGKKNGVLVPVEKNKTLIEFMLDEEHKFWENLKKNILPPLTESDYLIPEDMSELANLAVLREAKELMDNSKLNFESIKEQVTASFTHPKIAGAGLKIFKVAREGSLDLKSIPEIKAVLDSLDPSYINSFRKSGSESWSITMDRKGMK